MRFFRRMIRLARINMILMRYNIDEIVLGRHQFYLLRYLLWLNPYYWRLKTTSSRGERLRLALEDLGPIFVKVGQVLSTRRDLLPDDIAFELAKLQDSVPPFSGEIAKKIIEQELNYKIQDIFSEFNLEALASASIAQVHAAKLLNGEAVVVKVLRPQVRMMIERDIDLILTLTKFAERYWSFARYFKPQQIVNEIAQTLFDELDLMRECANASQLKRNFMQSSQAELLYIPKVYWDYCGKHILVMERIFGIPIYDVARLRHHGVNLKKLAQNGIEIFFAQIFRDSFFHADLHPGNIFVNARDVNNPTYIAVDFGIVGSLNQFDQRYLAENMVAFFKRDYQRVAELHIACGWLPPDTRVDQFEGAIRAVSEPIFSRPLCEVSFGQLLLNLFQVARRFHINIQPQLILLQKTLLSVEGLSRQLAPDLDLWAVATPQIEYWLKKQIGFKAFLKRVKNNLPLWSEQLPELPSLLYEVLHEKKKQQEQLRFNQSFSDESPKNKNNSITDNTNIISNVGYFVIGSLITALLIWLLIWPNK